MGDLVLPRILHVEITSTTIQVELNDGRTVLLPIGWFPRIEASSAEERKQWRLIAGGMGIHWESLDEDLSVENVVFGRPSGESPSSLQAWLSKRGPGRPARQRHASH